MWVEVETILASHVILIHPTMVHITDSYQQIKRGYYHSNINMLTVAQGILASPTIQPSQTLHGKLFLDAGNVFVQSERLFRLSTPSKLIRTYAFA